MPVEIVIAPPAAGKTQLAVQRVRTALQDAPLSAVWVIVPDRLQALAFRRRLAAAGGAIGARVATFGDIYREILESLGQPLPLASEPVVEALVRAAVAQVADQGRLEYYDPIRTTPGFAVALRERFAELKRGLVRPEELLEKVQSGPSGLAELARVYAAYQADLHARGWADFDGLSWLAVEAMQAHPQVPSGWRLLVVDGFDDFYPAQRRALQLLSQRVAEILVTLPGSREMQRAAHGRFRRALLELQANLAPELFYLEAQPRLPAPLRRLESQLFESQAPDEELSAEQDGHIFLLEMRSPADEAREALRWLKAHILRRGLPPGECAVFVPDQKQYGLHLRAAAAEFGLHLHFTWGESLAGAPAAAALLNLLDLARLDFPRRPTIDALRSPYFDWSTSGLSSREADLLELVSLHSRVTTGAGLWESALEELAGSGDQPVEEELPGLDEGQLPPSLPKGAAARRLLQAFQAWVKRLQPPGLRPVHAWVDWLEDLLEWSGFALRSEAVVATALRDVLRALLLSESLSAGLAIDYAAFLSLLRGALQSSVYRQRLQPDLGEILVGGLLEARGVRFAAVALLGLAEGVFPQVERADPFLDEPERQALGLEGRLGRYQASIFYQAATRAERALLLTRPYLAEGGQAWEPSPYWSAIEALFPHALRRISSDELRAVEQAASIQEAVFWAVRQGGAPQLDPQLQERLAGLAHSVRVLAARLADRPQGPFEGFAAGLAPELGASLGGERGWSASRLETYSACPQQFFVTYLLGLQPRLEPVAGYDLAQRGTMLHAILEAAYSQAADPGDPEAVLHTLVPAAAQVFARAPQEYGFRPGPLWQAQQADMLALLARSIQRLAEYSQGWQPQGYELPFGLRGAPPLVVQTAAGALHLHGVIDRLDRHVNGGLRVIDYKSGGGHLEKSDLLSGYRLQLPLYALAAREALGLGEPVEGFYWNLSAAEPKLQLSSLELEGESGPQAAIQLVLEHVERILQGVLAAEFPPLAPRGGCPGYCPAAAWCWRYQPGYSA